MTLVLVSLVLCAATLYALRGGLVGQRQFLTIAGFDTQSLGLGMLAVIAAAIYFGPLYGAAIILTVMIHEFGHVAAYRVCGHSDARFRLIPLFGGVAISDQAPSSQEKDFFIALLGPGICIAPMVLALFVSDRLMLTAPELAEFLYVFAMVTGVLNFFNLLPFWPLDGGRCIASLCNSFAPGLVPLLTFAMSGLAVTIAVMTQTWLLVIFLLFNLHALRSSIRLTQVQRAMPPARAVLATGAYAFTLATFASVGWPLVAGLL